MQTARILCELLHDQQMSAGRNLGCKYGQPHDLKRLGETVRDIWEVCQICTKKFRWAKRFKGRIENAQYLKAHIRNFAQPSGPTKSVYDRVYNPKTIIIT